MALNALHIQSHKTQLILVAVVASLATAALITTHSTYTRRAHRKALGEEVSKALAAKDLADEEVARFAHEKEAYDPQYAGYDEGLVREQLARNYAFFGEEAMTKIRKGTVAIVGCGGVGSWAAVMLVRSYVCIEHACNELFLMMSPLEACQRSGWWTLTTSRCPRSTGMLQLA